MARANSGAGLFIARRDGVVYQFDSNGRLRQLLEPNGNAISYEYDASGRLIRVTGPSTRTATLQYDGSGRITQITDAAGLITRYAYDASGRLHRVTDPQGLTVTYQYDTSGQITTVTDDGGRAVLFTHDGSGRLTSYRWRDVPGTTAFTYTTSVGQRVTTIADPAGHATTFTTNQGGNLIERKDALGHIYRYDYDPQQRLVRVTNPRGLVTEIAYEQGPVTPRVVSVVQRGTQTLTTTFGDFTSLDQPRVVTDPSGVVTRRTYDQAGNLTSEVVASGTVLAATTQYTYDSRGMLLTVTDATGGVTRYDVDNLGQVVAITNPLGGITRFAYDTAGNPTRVTDPSGSTVQHEYDSVGRRVRTVYPDGGVQTWTYDRSGLLVAQVNPGNVRTTFRYDDAGRPIEQVDALNHAVQTVYDAAWRPILTKLPNGSMQRQEYDVLGRVARTYHGEQLSPTGEPLPGAKPTTFEYDAAGNLTGVTYPNGYKVSAEYDLFNRLISETRPPATTRYQYDGQGRLAAVQDANGKWTRYQYDILGRLTRVYDAANLTAEGQPKPDTVYTAYEYDRLGRRTKVTSPMGHTTAFEYDAAGNLILERDPLGQMTLRAFDNAGRLLRVLDRNGNTTSYEYDALGRVTTIHYEDDRDSVSYTYDAAGRRLSMADSLGITYYWYDQVGRLLQERSPRGTLQYEYDPSGLRTALVMPEGRVTYGYDRANRLIRVTDITGAHAALQYGESGELLGARLPGQVTLTNIYNSETNRVTERKYTGNGNRSLTFTYEYDLIGQVISTTKQDRWDAVSTETQRYEFDDLYRLQYAYNSRTGRYQGYSYDADGNRLVEEEGSYSQSGSTYNRTKSNWTTYEYSPAGWLTRTSFYASISTTQPDITYYAYDGEGNLLQVAGSNRWEWYTYNSRGQMIKAQAGNQFTYNRYDGDGRRVSRRVTTVNYGQWKETPTQTSQYQYDGIFVVAERDGAGGLKTAYARTPGGQLLSWYKPQQDNPDLAQGAFLLDHLGSVVKMTRASDGRAENHYDYDAFGRVTSATEVIPNDMKFTGALLDTSGLYHLNARFYNPNLGRFMTQDTWKGTPWQPWTQNLYVYVGNNPVNYVDPSGHCAQLETSYQPVDCAEVHGGGGGGMAIPYLLYKVIESLLFPDPPSASSKTSEPVASSWDLANNMEAAGLGTRPDCYAAHHIVPGGMKDAEAARQILDKFGVGINDAVNGVYLPHERPESGCGGGEVYHRTLHTKDYVSRVTNALRRARSKDDVVEILRYIGEQLQSGNAGF